MSTPENPDPATDPPVGSPENPVPAPALGWTMGLVTDPWDYSRDGEVQLPQHPPVST